MSFDGTQAFFTGEKSPIPQNWTYFKKVENARAISIFVILVPNLGFLFYNIFYESKQNKKLTEVFNKNLLQPCQHTY